MDANPRKAALLQKAVPASIVKLVQISKPHSLVVVPVRSPSVPAHVAGLDLGVRQPVVVGSANEPLQKHQQA
ncbi:hypothetical protein P60_gp45 [Synechococcus phage P60]|uniref:Uncharacterized protein n=1 Tax=Synechococcus phage P60 TaxID=2905923 RepID=Q8W6X0_9CAUD|nr:hypothetical protein P60_gp45 [Synechococcus phage P60]AAL73309.1 hypothetical protein P60_gp45 [Synechococcus phage P60]